MRRKKLVAGLSIVGVAAAGGVAWALIGGFLVVPDVVQGAFSGGGAASCQTTSVTFTLPDPSFNSTIGTYTVDEIAYSGITAACQTLGTADIELVIWDGSIVLADGSDANIGAGGVISLSQPVDFDTAANADYRYIVKNT